MKKYLHYYPVPKNIWRGVWCAQIIYLLVAAILFAVFGTFGE